jgi:hypothetical protein
VTNSPYQPAFGAGRMFEQMRGKRRYPPLRVRARDPVQRHTMIAEAAYFRAERRSFESGHELEDWLGAEAELERSLRSERSRPS